MNWQLFVVAAGLAFVLEGIAYFLFAERMAPLLRMLSEQPPRFLRGIGLAAIVAGLVFVFLGRGL